MLVALCVGAPAEVTDGNNRLFHWLFARYPGVPTFGTQEIHAPVWAENQIGYYQIRRTPYAALENQQGSQEIHDPEWVENQIGYYKMRTPNAALENQREKNEVC